VSPRKKVARAPHARPFGRSACSASRPAARSRTLAEALLAGDVEVVRRGPATTRCAPSRSWQGAPLSLARLPSLKASEAPGGSRASLVGQHVVVVLDDIRVLRRVDQRVVLIGGLLAVVAPTEPAEGSPEVHLRPLPGVAAGHAAAISDDFLDVAVFYVKAS
jgi:hypothetical protein